MRSIAIVINGAVHSSIMEASQVTGFSRQIIGWNLKNFGPDMVVENGQLIPAALEHKTAKAGVVYRCRTHKRGDWLLHPDHCTHRLGAYRGGWW